MTRILLMRHGLTDTMSRILCGRMPNVHLNDAGRRQVDSLASGVKSRYQLREIVSSPLERAVETAAEIQRLNPGNLTLDNDLTELDYGRWTGMPFDDVKGLAEWQQYNLARSTGIPPGGESLMQVQSRAWSAVERILNRNDEQRETTVGVVTHGDVIRSLLMLLLGIPLDHIQRFDVSLASLSEITFEKRHARVICVNRNFY